MKPRRIILALLLLLPLAGCGHPMSVLNPAGPAASNLSQVGWVVFITFSVVAFVTIVFVLWSVFRRRGGSLDYHEPWDIGGGLRSLFIYGFIIPLIVLCGIFVYSLTQTSNFPLSPTTQVHPEIVVVGHQWWWEVHYISGPLDTHFVTANEIHIPVGRPIDIALKTADVVHSFWVPELHGKMELIPGQTNVIRVEANRPGVFHGQCSEYCGEQHAKMRMLIVAQTPEQYQAWKMNELAPAAEPQTAQEKQGRQAFVNAACALCHTIRGTLAMGKVAPDLTHLGSRLGIAADSFDNNKANLGGWVVHAQSLKPGCKMPDLAVFTGPRLRDLVDYLESLK